MVNPTRPTAALSGIFLRASNPNLPSLGSVSVISMKSYRSPNFRAVGYERNGKSGHLEKLFITATSSIWVFGLFFYFAQLTVHPFTQRARFRPFVLATIRSKLFSHPTRLNIYPPSPPTIGHFHPSQKQPPQCLWARRKNPFKFEAWWIKAKGEDVIKENWNSNLESRAYIIQHCSIGLLNWSKASKPIISGKIVEIKKSIERLQKGCITEATKEKIHELSFYYDLLLEQNNLKWKQRAKQHWYREGDRNTNFFHNFASQRREINHIAQLKDSTGMPQSEDATIEKIIGDYFTDIFSSSNPSYSDMQYALRRVRHRVTPTYELAGKSTAYRFARRVPRYLTYFFVDDTLLFKHATMSKLSTFVMLFDFTKKSRTISAILNISGHAASCGHGKYLGLPSVVSKSKKEVFTSIKDTVWAKLQGWKERHLSQVGKEILIKSVIQSIPVFAMSCFKLPDVILDDIQRMMKETIGGEALL
ncbi:hypothetical protein DH2020_027378 [Rehmannia glutinosa]|uniref:Uncharacterized protein n=1 Tax=Rehmannia glutinosa TaxID=99300 RepID=A0ABR0VVA2_REHGL